MKSPYPLYRSSNPLFEESSQLDIFKGKPFWCNNQGNEIDCCFNHIIGLPEKNNKSYPIFDYELDVIKKIESNRNIWIKKASGIGATELILRYLTWKILVNNDLEYKSIFIVSGTYVHHAAELKIRMENLFRKKFQLLKLDSKFTDLWIKNTNIKIFPSRNVKDLRGYTNVSYLFIDEADHFEPSVNNELLAAITRYEEKSNCTTIMVSTPNRPGQLYESIEKDPHSKYCKIFLDYTVGLDKIYDRKEIEKKKLEPEFPREYECKYLGRIGNVFLPSQIQRCQELNEEFSIEKIPVSLYTLKSVGLDPAFSTSSFGLITLEHIKTNTKDVIRVIQCELIDKADPNEMVEKCWQIWKRHNFINTIFFIDPSNRAMTNLLKIRFDEPLTWETKQTFGHNIRIRPVSFTNENKRDMLSNLHAMITKEYLAIDPKYDKLITSLRTCYADEMNLKKEVVSYNDLLDSLMLALKGYQIE